MIFKVLSLLSQHQRLQNTRPKEKGEYLSSLELEFPANTSSLALDAPKDGYNKSPNIKSKPRIAPADIGTFALRQSNHNFTNTRMQQIIPFIAENKYWHCP